MQTKQFLVVVLLLSLAACANQREPASAAIRNIQMTLNSAVTDAEQHAPAELAAVQSKVAELQASFDKKDYDAVVSAAPAVLKQTQELHGVIFKNKTTAKMAALAEWPQIAVAIVQWLPATQAQLQKLQKQAKPPEGVDLAAAQSALEGIDEAWSKAQKDNNSGRVESGLAQGKEVKSRIENAAAALKFTLPEVKPFTPPVVPPPPA